MRVDELDLKHRLWSLPASRVKNASPHTVPLSEMAVEIIREALDEAGEGREFVFPSGDGSMPAHAVAKTITRATKTSKDHPVGRFGLAAFTAHDLRRTALTELAKLGIAPLVLGHVANHRTVTKAGVTLGVYVQHTFEHEKREALDLWARRLAAIVVGEPVADVMSIARRA